MTETTTCQNCETTTTPLWRRDDAGQILCNACGLFLKLHNRPRPISLKTDVIKPRNRSRSSILKKRHRPAPVTANNATNVLPSTPSSIFNTHQVKLPALSSLYESTCNNNHYHHHNYSKNSYNHNCCGNKQINSSNSNCKGCGNGCSKGCSNNNSGVNSLLMTPMMTPQSSPNLPPKYQQNYPLSEQLQPTYLEKVPKMTTLDSSIRSPSKPISDGSVQRDSRETPVELRTQLKELSLINELLQNRVYQLEASESSIRESELRLRHQLQEEERRNEELMRRLREIMKIM